MLDKNIEAKASAAIDPVHPLEDGKIDGSAEVPINANIPVEDEMNVDLYKIYQEEQGTDKYSLFEKDYREIVKYLSTDASKRMNGIYNYAKGALGEAYKENEDLISLDKDRQERLEVSAVDNQKFYERLTDRLASMEIDEELAGAALGAFTENRKKNNRYIAEQQAMREIANMSKDNPSWQLFSLDQTDAFEYAVEKMQKEAIIRSFIDQKAAENDITPVWEEFLDDTGELFFSILGDEVFQALGNSFGDSEAKRLMNRAAQIRDLPVEDLQAALDEYNEELLNYSTTYSYLMSDNEDAMEDLQNSFGTQYDRLNSQGLLGMDAALTLLTLGAGVSTKPASGSLKNSLKKLGDPKKVARDVMNTINNNKVEGDTVKSVAEAVEESLPIKVGDGDDVYVHHSTAEVMEEITAVLDDVSTLASPNRLKPNELKDAVENTLSKMKIGGNYVNTGVDYNIEKGVYEISLVVGKKDGTGYKNKKTAMSTMNKYGIKGEVFETETGFKIRQKVPVIESLADDGLVYKPVGAIKRFLQGPKAFVDSYLGIQGTSSAFKEARISGVAKDVYNKYIHSLTYREREELSPIFEEGASWMEDGIEGKWFSPDELADIYRTKYGKEISPKLEQAYFASVKLHDFSWFIQNRSIYQDKVSKGLRSIYLEGLPSSFNGKVYNSSKEFVANASGHFVRDFDKGETVRADAEYLKNLADDGYVLVRPEDASWTPDIFSDPASFIAVKKSSLYKIGDLDWDQLGYVAGGRREYVSPFFIGQQSSFKASDGSRYVGAPRVFRTADTMEQANGWVSTINRGMEVLKDFRDRVDAVNRKKTSKQADKDAEVAQLRDTFNEKMIKETRFSLDDFDDMAREGNWDLSSPMMIKRDRGEFPVDWDSMEVTRLYDKESISSGFGFKQGNRLSARGTKLKHVNETDSITLDYMSALRSSMDQAIKFGAYNEYRISAINRFATQFGKYFDDPKLTPYEMATSAEPSAELATSTLKSDRDAYRAIKAHQFYIKSILRVRTKWDEMIQNSMNNMAEWIEGVDFIPNSVATSLYKAGNPIEKIRGLNYDLNLGMFNPAQFILQAQSAVTAMAMSPKYGMQSFKDAFALRMALILNDDASTAYINKKIRELGGDIDDYTDVEKSAAQFKRLGMHNFGTNIAMMDRQNTVGVTTNPFMNAQARVREAGRIFFQEGERIGRMVAYGIAKRKIAERFPKMDIYSDKADILIREEADRLLLSPNADNNQMFTKGALSLPTQFWSYMAKMADVFMTGANGRYTGKERALLAGSQILFYGSAGMPFLDYIVEGIEKNADGPIDPTAAKFIHNGIIDGIVFVASGGEMNTDLSDSAGFGGFTRMMYENLSENPMMHVMLGATGGNINRAIDKMAATASLNGLWLNADPSNITETAFAGVSSLVKSMDKASQAYMAFNTGIWYDKYGRKVFNVSKAEALASLGGMQPQALTDMYKIISDNKDARQKYINDVSTQLQGLHNKYDLAETDEERQHIRDMIEALSVISMQTGYWGDVSHRFMSFQKDPTYLDSLQRRLQEEYAFEKGNPNPTFLSIEQREELNKEREE